MKTIIASTLALVLCSGALVAAEDKEPELGYTLLVDDQPIRLQPNKETVIAGTFTNLHVRLIPEQERHFTYGGLSFKYPAHFAFEADFRTPGVKLWTLNGNDFVIMVQKYDDLGIGPGQLVSQLKKKYGEATKTSKISHRLNGREYSGIRISVELATIRLFQDVLEIPTEKGSRLLMLQDLHAEEKVSGEEAKTVLRLLNETLKLHAQPLLSPRGQ
jgi:hypothetical protein